MIFASGKAGISKGRGLHKLLSKSSDVQGLDYVINVGSDVKQFVEAMPNSTEME